MTVREQIIAAMKEGQQTITEISEWIGQPYTVVASSLRRMSVSGIVFELGEDHPERHKRFKLEKPYGGERKTWTTPQRDPLVAALFGPPTLTPTQ